MSIQTLRFFEIYTAVTSHFAGGSYDYFKYDGDTSVNENSFLKRKDKYFFERWKSKCPDEDTALGLCVSNNITGNKYIRNYSDETYKKWLIYNDKLEYNFGTELDIYLAAKEILIPWEDSALQLLVNMVISGKLSTEFMILFNIVLDGGLYSELEKTNNYVWEGMKGQQLRYAPFLKRLWNLHPGVIFKLKSIAKTK